MSSSTRDIPCIDVIKSAWATFRDNLPMTLGSSAVVWLIPSVISGLVFACMVIVCIIFGDAAILQLKLDVGPEAMQQAMKALLPLASIVIVGIALYIGTFFAIFNFMSIGWKQILLTLASGKPPEFSALFDVSANGRFFWKLLITNILITSAISIGLMFLVIPGIFFALRLCLAPYLVIDRDLGPIKAMKASNELVAGYSWQIALLLLLFNVVALVAILVTKLIPILGPVLLLAVISFYSLVLAKIYLMRTEGIELQAPQFKPTAGPPPAADQAYSSPRSVSPTNNVKKSLGKTEGLREWETSGRGNETRGIVYVVSIVLILGLGAAFVYGVSVGHKEQSASSLGSGSVGTSTEQTVSDPIPGNAVAPNPVAFSLGKPEPPSDYLSATVPYTDNQMADKFVRFKVDSPLGQSKLQLEVLAPKDWRGKDVRISKQQMAKGGVHPLELAELECHSPNTSLEAWYMPASADQPVTLDQFFSDYCQSMGFSVVKHNSKPDRIEAIIKYNPKDVKPMLARITFIRVGENIFWLAGCAPESEFGNWSNVFCVAAASFSPVGYNAGLHPDVASRTSPGSEFSE